MTLLSIIVARARNGIIGRDNALPWHIPGELGHFKRTTMGKPIIMGRKTFESIGRPLPGRRNIVVTRNADWSHSGCERAASLDEAIALAGDAEEAFVIGGAQLYAEAIPRADRLIITEIDRDYEGDAALAAVDAQRFREVRREVNHTEDTPPLRYDFVTYERI